MQKTVIINRGIPASGKSTFAKIISNTLQKVGISSEIHSTDNFFMVEDKFVFNPNKLQEYHLKNQNNFFNSLKEKCDVVICDNTNIEPWEIKPYFNMAKEFDYKVLLLNFSLRDINEHIKDSKNKNIPLEVIKNFYEKFENIDIEIKNYEDKIYDIKIDIDSKDFEKIKNNIGNIILNRIREYSINEIKLIPEHHRIIIKQIEKKVDKTITAKELTNIIGKSDKQISRYFKELVNEFPQIIETKKGKANAIKLIDSFDIFIEAFKELEDSEQLNELMYLVKESAPELFKRLDTFIHNPNSIYIFKNPIFETIKNREIFKKLKNAIINHEYRLIKFKNEEKFIEIKPIKFLFTDNNWYLAYVSEDTLRLGRIAFIEEIKYSKKNNYQKKSIERYLELLDKKFQNSMTLFDADIKKAKLKALPNIARYFEKDMKKFFPSQKFIEKLEDGSIIFEINYTQELEILPFVQKWLPDLVILEPKELIEAFVKKLDKAKSFYKKLIF